jgi:hypothetical protein
VGSGGGLVGGKGRKPSLAASRARRVSRGMLSHPQDVVWSDLCARVASNYLPVEQIELKVPSDV